MKIALFVDQFPRNSETFVLSQVDGLLACGHELTIFPCEAGNETNVHSIVQSRRLMEKAHYPRHSPGGLWGKMGFYILLMKLNLFHRQSISRLRATFGRYSGFVNWRWALMRAEPVLHHGGQYDVLFAHFGPNGLRAGWYRDAGLVDRLLVTVFHGFDLSRYLSITSERVYDSLFRNGELFLPISLFWQRKLRTLGCAEEKIKVHHVGIDCHQFTYHARTRAADEPTVLVSVARLVEKKGIEYSIRAVARLVALNLNVEYRIIGNGPLLASLQRLVSELRLNECIRFLGEKSSDEVADELSVAHLFVAPSITSDNGDMEGIPTVLMEAMATGLPVISTLHSGIPELVDAGVSGELVNERDIDGLTQAIQVLATNVERWPAMGIAGREKVLNEFNIEQLNNRLERLFEDGVRCKGYT